jgi:hypothetical protein
MGRDHTIAVCVNPNCNKPKKIRARGLCFTCYNKQSTSNKKYEKSDKGKQRQVRYREKRCYPEIPYLKKEPITIVNSNTSENVKTTSNIPGIGIQPSCVYYPSMVNPNFYCDEPYCSDYMTSKQYINPQLFSQLSDTTMPKTAETIQKEYEIARFMQYLLSQPDSDVHTMLNMY